MAFDRLTAGRIINIRLVMRAPLFIVVMALLTGCATARDQIDYLVADLSATRGMWINGVSPIIHLPENASPKQVLDQVFQMTGFDRGHVKHYKILKVRRVHIDGGLYTAALVETDLGKKIVLFSAGGRWSRVYDTKPRPSRPGCNRTSSWA